MKQIRLDCTKLDKKTEAHEYLKEKLELPEYYGSNLDALYDCLTELAETEIIFENAALGELYFEKLKRVFKDAARDNENLKIQFSLS